MPQPTIPRVGPPSLPSAFGTQAGSTIGMLMGHPLWGAIIGNIGSSLLQRIMGPELPYGQYAEEQMGAINSMLPELRSAAQGLPTAGSRAIQDQVRAEGNRQQQSYAQGARQRGMVGGLPGGTTPYAAQQGRVQAATQSAMTQQLGQHQIAAQQTLAGMSPTAMQHMGVTQLADQQARGNIMSALGRFSGEFMNNRNNPQYQEMMAFLRELYFSNTP